MNLAQALAHFVRDATHKLDAIFSLTKLNHHHLEEIMTALDDLKAEVETIKTDIGGAVTKITDLIALVATLQANTVTDADLQAVTDSLKAAAAPLEAIINPPAETAAG